MNKSEIEYFDNLAETIFKSFSAIHDISKFTKNSAVLGAFAESLLFQFITRVVSPLKISTGTIISPEHYASHRPLPQFDLIFWDPNPIPAILAEDRFALIPKNSALAVLEVKKTDYDQGLDDITKKSTEIAKFLPNGCQHLFLGVVCVREHLKKEGDNKLMNLVRDEKAVYLMELENGQPSINPVGIYSLVNFLGAVRSAATRRQAQFTVLYPGAITFPA